MNKTNLILKMTDIDKRFTGVHALKNAYLDLYAGGITTILNVDYKKNNYKLGASL